MKQLAKDDYQLYEHCNFKKLSHIENATSLIRHDSAPTPNEE